MIMSGIDYIEFHLHGFDMVAFVQVIDGERQTSFESSGFKDPSQTSLSIFYPLSVLMYFKRATSVDKSKGPLKWSQVLISIHFGNASCSGAMSGECSGVKGTASGIDDSLLSGDIINRKPFSLAIGKHFAIVVVSTANLNHGPLPLVIKN